MTDAERDDMPMYFRGNMRNEEKQRCVKASKQSDQRIEFRKPSNRLTHDRINYFGLWGPWDMSSFWEAYDRINSNCGWI